MQGDSLLLFPKKTFFFFYSSYSATIPDVSMLIMYCNVVIYNYVFVGFYFVSNLIVILFNLMYPVFHVGFICKGCVRERECVLRLKAIED